MKDQIEDIEWINEYHHLGLKIEVDYTPEDENGEVVASADFTIGNDHIMVQGQPAWPPGSAIDELNNEIDRTLKGQTFSIPFSTTIKTELAGDMDFAYRLKDRDMKWTAEIKIELSAEADWEAWIETMSINLEPKDVPAAFSRGGTHSGIKPDAPIYEVLEDLVQALFIATFKPKLFETEIN